MYVTPQRRTLGRTGESVSCVGLGGSHIGGSDLEDKDAIALIRRAVDNGLNFLDNSWDYHDGRSEKRMGKALKDGYRDKVFLMTKFDGRNRKTAAEQIDESLERLQVDHLDLLQYHELIRFDDVDRFFAEGGAGEALLEAQRSGKTRYIGFTGHKDPSLHLYMLEQAAKHDFDFHAVQMPLNVMDPHFRSFSELVVPKAQKMGLGILGMKSLGGGVILKSGAVSAPDCLRYALTLPTSVVITGIDSDHVLDQALEAGASFAPMAAQEIEILKASTKTFGEDGQYELFKTTSLFDATAQNPEWLGEETSQVKQMMD